LIVGSLPWLSFCESLSRGAASLLDAGGLLQKTALPPVLFVARSVIAGWAVFAPLMVFLGDGISQCRWNWLVSFGAARSDVFAVAVAFLLAYVCAILAAALRDTTQVLSFTLSIGIFMSPVLFPINLFPEGWRWVLYLNPMTPLVLGYQSIMLQGQWPEPTDLAGSAHMDVVLAWVLLSTLLKRSREEIIDWL
jgi:lipopolysaccharide transport system permease protein